MAKKSRRARRSQRTDAVPRPAPVPPIDEMQQETTDFYEYQYVISDLKRVAILALGMFALLVLLSLFIR